MLNPISITAIASVSPLGNSLDEIWTNYQNASHFITQKSISNQNEYVAEFSQRLKNEIEVLKNSTAKYKTLDNSVLYAIYASRKAIEQANWSSADNFGINIGSSRGATTLFEKYHQDYLENNVTKVLSSPTTTLGNISSWVAHDLKTKGPEISHSITCSTALHALLNGMAWINSGMCQKFLIGGSEAPLTGFTLAQMQALNIYAKQNHEYPCRAMDFSKNNNTMVLGEAAAAVCLEKGVPKNALATIKGIGYATELLEHNASLSAEAVCFQDSMAMALKEIPTGSVDIIITHTPGTMKGDLAEYNAIKSVFGNNHPSLTNNKWKIGHSLGASGVTSLELAILMLQNQHFVPVPFVDQKAPKQIKTILINSVGFGGNAVSILLELPNNIN